jgi:SRSO17 transposase
MLEIHRAGILFYCPIKANRTVSEIRVDQKYMYQQAETLVWTQEELDLGKQVHLKEFPAGLELKLFRVAISTEGSASSPSGAGLRARTELIVTNDPSSLDSEAVRFVLGFRWKVEQFHREVKQVTGIESCECRSARAQRNHVGFALLVWVGLKRHA